MTSSVLWTVRCLVCLRRDCEERWLRQGWMHAMRWRYTAAVKRIAALACGGGVGAVWRVLSVELGDLGPTGRKGCPRPGRLPKQAR